MSAVKKRVTASVALLCSATAVVLTGCSSLSSAEERRSESGGRAATRQASPEAPRLFDLRSLISPKKKYFGAAVEGAPSSMAPVAKYGQMVGKKPNLLEYYAAWGDGFNTQGVRNAWAEGALTVLSWEPADTPIADIADGKSDAYVKEFAEAARKLNIPIVISFADEMNGHWEKWGTKHVKPEDYVRAWKRVHDVFADAGAGNVIWAWSPNIVNPVRNVDIADYYPGDGYVDWVGMVGYFTTFEPNTFDGVFGLTIKKIRTFTDKPLLILETAAEPGERRLTSVRSLLEGVKGHDDIVGFVWFDYRKRSDWRLSVSPLALAEFKRLAADDTFGFDVRKP
ncbi:glycoside hydrolase family 26 protein [Streptomyces sp. NPDC001678]|uniref:glycoside hydrolase family 26 protein n=1 Tax=Streptomyces sp. NPDC001678 TaxID=3364599 RepID=UPI0036CE178E